MTKVKGVISCLLIAIPAWYLGGEFPLIGGPVFAILIGMVIAIFWKEKNDFQEGITFVSKKILQYAVILLGFGLNLLVLVETGLQSLPIIFSTIATSLILSHILKKILNIPPKISTLIGVGSSICGGSAVAATAPVIKASDEEVAQAISVIFFFNVIAALVFPSLGTLLGFSTVSGEGFGIFVGSAVNDTSSVTATAATWDAMYDLGSSTLDKAVTVKLTRTLAIIPITMFLAYKEGKKKKTSEKVSLKKIFPMFILYFVLASLITSLVQAVGIETNIFGYFKTLSKFFIVLAMAAIGLNTDFIKLVKSGAKPLILGASCWFGIALVSFIMQSIMKLL